ncbi:aegerolysin family protein [Streptomyces albipurpureus]|uniref:Aegerolysin family protein n=1 Tax=Streptomyces albipurpureus TaxID=2897419 RepID=A0ABT0UFD2_9ACTN|nr:aegerolysin family protein [Streptomyces sp. CWNU-1]MCM2387319.1 aegerolysin family protein [Streptomyces sp. CWNU-1]
MQSITTAPRPVRLGFARRAASVLVSAAIAMAGMSVLAPNAAAAEKPNSVATAKSPVGVQAARSTKVVVVNKTGTNLQRSWTDLAHGCWTNGALPPDNISDDRTISWQSESCGFMTGTEGTAKYSLSGGEVNFYWNNPYAGRNSYDCSAPAGYRCQVSGGGGNNAVVTMTLTRNWAASSARSAAAGAPSTQAAQAARSTHVTFNNHTAKPMIRTNAWLSWGVWTTNMYPVQSITPGTSTSWQSESEGFMTGTEGGATYVLPEVGSVHITWNNPYAGSNKYSCSAPSGFRCSTTGGGGNNAYVTFTLR